MLVIRQFFLKIVSFASRVVEITFDISSCN